MRVLMCPPIYIEATWEDPQKNAYQNMSVQPDKDLALKQWSELVGTYRRLGAEIYVLEPQPGLGDMCFTANAAWGRNGIFVLANFSPEGRRQETKFHARWLVDNRFSVHFLPEHLFFEGQGDIVTLKNAYLYGYGIRNSLEAMEYIKEVFRLKKQVIPLRLTSPAFYHADMALHYLKAKETILYYPEAFDEDSLQRLAKLKIKRVEFYADEIIQNVGSGRRNFLLNSSYIVSENSYTEVISWDIEHSPLPKKMQKLLAGVSYRTVNLSEFSLLGGGGRCLTLFLD